MPRRKPETLALAVSLAGTLIVLLVFMADLVVARHRDLESGERRLQHFGIMMAEHTARTFEAVEYATLEWVDWFNNRRLLEPIGNIPPAEAEQRYYAAMDHVPIAA